MNDNAHPHDSFVRQAMSNIEVAREFFENYLPREVVAKIDLSTLSPKKDTFVDNVAGIGAVDALFSVKFDREDGYLYLLSEHQSSIDRFMSLRLMKYMLMICDNHCKSTKSKHLPLIYPVVYYSGKKKYTAPLDFFQLFSKPDLAKEYFIGPYQLIDLNKLADDDIKKTLWVGAMFYLMKHIQDTDILPFLIDFKSHLKEIAGINYLYVEAIFMYIVNNTESNKSKNIVDLFSNIVPSDKRERVMTTIAEQWKLEGMEKACRKACRRAWRKVWRRPNMMLL
jgi:predicted transposase/invertase (TIGR01784 family)